VGRPTRESRHGGAAEAVPAGYATPVPSVDHGAEAGIVASHTLLPDVLFHSFSAFGAMMAPELPLQRRQHEMIATMVSVTNRCHY